MAKAQKQPLPAKNVPTIEGMKASDLSPEKRIELFQVEFNKFNTEMADKFGLALGAEILATPKAIVPRIVLVDLLANKGNEQAKASK